VLDAPLVYRTPGGYEYQVPKGFKCDLASVPKILAALAPDWRQSARAGVLHDWLYRTGFLTRRQADLVFYYALLADEVSSFRAWAMYQAVRKFARKPWRKYREES